MPRTPQDPLIALAINMAGQARTVGASPEETAGVLLSLGLEECPVVRRVLTRHGHLTAAEVPAADAALAGQGASA
ncbi:hypothetical protein [Nocardioides sp. Leaf285]|uniref:hypothetical protein n=1 Tax=Nocardioides sp. Leaf285 TaxID=1736322 RepID=UPI0007039B2D|nr:hypothetical protein [Nocardioides sp. Leaf285]KQP62962.1 hypothetical protein ASF47_18290 [Nocardioides sp. Leaf285]